LNIGLPIKMPFFSELSGAGPPEREI